MKSSGAFLLFASAALISCSSPPTTESTKKTSEAIQGGTADTTDTFAVAVTNGEALCSGTLIAPNLVLTARHCIESTLGAGGACENGTINPDPSSLSVVVASSLQAGPGANPYTASNLYPMPDVSSGCSPDQALIELAEPIPSSIATPVRPAVEPSDLSAAHFTSKVTAIGFGLDDQGNPGTRRIKEDLAVLCVAGDSSFACADGAVADYQIEVAAGPCEGDSGGGLYDQTSFDAKAPIVVATVVGGPMDQNTGVCGNGVYTRVDKFASFIIERALAAAKDGGYTAPVWAVPVAELPDAGGDASIEPPTDDDAGTSPDPNGPKATTVTTTTSGCSIARGSSRDESELGFAAGIFGLALIVRRSRRRHR